MTKIIEEFAAEKAAAEIQQVKANVISTYIAARFTPESAVACVDADDRSLLVHTGLTSAWDRPAT
jgi:hypothetical protein